MDKTFRVLIVDPNTKSRNQFEQWLSGIGGIICEKTPSSDAFTEVKPRWDLIIMRFNPHNHHELTYIQSIKDKNPVTAVLVIAENIRVEFIQTMLRYHVDRLLFSPIKKNEFLENIRELLEEYLKRKEHKSKVVLAIGAHPDDVEIGCAGTLAKHREEGDRIHILTMSSGAVGGHPSRRIKEAKIAAKMQGATLYLGRLPDTKILNTIDTIRVIENIIHTIHPTHIYTHTINDNHQDHRNIHQASIIACRQIANVYSYHAPSSTVDFRPNFFVNIDDYLEEKIRVLQVFESQTAIRPYLEPEMIRATAKYWGRFYNYHYVEPMEVLKENP